MEILIVSFWDFQDRGMQATKRTPLYFAHKGHKVTFLVHSEMTNCPNNQTDLPANLKYIRFDLPFKWLKKIPKLNRLRLLVLFGLHCFSYSLKTFSKQNKPDIIYAAECDAIIVGYLLNIFLKTVFVTRYYGVSTALLMHPLKHFLYQISLRLPADVAIMTNDGTNGKNILRSVNGKIGVIYFWRNGIDRPLLNHAKIKAYSEKYGFKSNEMILLTMSRLYSWKRVDRSIKAIHSLIEERKIPLKLLIVGDGPEMFRLQELTSQLGIEKNVEFAGGISHEEIYYLYGLADVFISGYDMSNVGNPLWEAINAGKCIVVLNTGKTGEVIEDGVNGLLVDYSSDEKKNVSSLANAIIKLYENPDLRIKLAQGAAEYGRKNLWTWDERLSAEVEILERHARKR